MKENSGVLHLPLAAALGLAAVAGLGFLSIGQHWKSKVRVQLALDRCTGELALELRRRVEAVESGNRRLELLRLTAAGALAAGNAPAFRAARTAITLTARGQDLELLAWRRQQVRWPLRSECGGAVRSPPLPEIPMLRPKPDPLGESPLAWKGSRLELFSIRASRGGRNSTSFVFRSHQAPHSPWTASWRQPHAATLD